MASAEYHPRPDQRASLGAARQAMRNHLPHEFRGHLEDKLIDALKYVNFSEMKDPAHMNTRHRAVFKFVFDGEPVHLQHEIIVDDTAALSQKYPIPRNVVWEKLCTLSTDEALQLAAVL